MNRPRRPSSASPAKPSAPVASSPAPHDHETDAALLVSLAQAAAILLAGLIWGIVFFQAVPQRSSLMMLAAAPDLFVQEWLGNGLQPVAVLDRLPILLAAGAILAASYAAGYALLAVCRVTTTLQSLERTSLAIGAGLNLFSLYVLAVGLAGGLRQRGVFLVPVAIGVLWTLWHVAQRIRERFATNARDERAPLERKIGRWAFGLSAPFVVAMLLGAMLPPWDFDVREYHLQVPKEWRTAGRISFLPHNVYGNMPLGAEMQAILGMAILPADDRWWWGALVGKLMMATYVPLTAVLLFAAARRWMSPWAALVAPVIFVSSPWVAHTAVSGLNEPAVAFYVVAAVVACCVARANRWAWLVAGFFAGAAAACKYPAVVLVVLPLALSPFVKMFVENTAAAGLERVRRAVGDPRAWLWAGCFVLGASLGCGLWYAKNLALTGNPVYPLAAHWFDGMTRTAEKTAQWNRAHQVPRNEEGNRYSAEQASAAVANLAWRGLHASPLLFPLLVWAAVGAIARPWLRLREENESPPATGDARLFGWLSVGLLVWITAVWWLATHRLERFWIPALPLAALSAAWVMTLVRGRAERVMLFVLIGVALLYSGLAISSKLVGDNRWFVSLAALRSDATVEEGMPSRISPAHRWLMENRSPAGAVLLVGDAEPFDLAPPVFYNTCFDDCLLVEWGTTAAERHQVLDERSVEFVYLDWSELRRYQSPGNYGYDPRWNPSIVDELVGQQILTPVVEISREGLAEVTTETAQPAAKSAEQLGGTIYRVSLVAWVPD